MEVKKEEEKQKNFDTLDFKNKKRMKNVLEIGGYNLPQLSNFQKRYY